MEDKEDEEGEGAAEGDAEAPAEGEGEKAAPNEDENRPKTVEEPIKVVLDGDSDDDFALIDIKEKVKKYIEDNGKDVRIVPDIINDAVRWRLERNDC